MDSTLSRITHQWIKGIWMIELIFMGWTVGYVIGMRAFLNKDAPSSFIDSLIADGYEVCMEEI